MGLNYILLLIGALLPAIALGIYIYVKDRADKEPLWLLLLLLFSGTLIIIPILIVSLPVEIILPMIFPAEIGTTESLRDCIGHGINALSVGITEEGFKWLALVIITKKSKHFNSLFDGIIYAVFVSLGFAAPENVLYCLTSEGGWTVAIMRAIMSVPGHVFFGVMMGYFYSMWHMNSKAKAVENVYKQRGLIPENTKSFPVAKFAVLSYVVPMLAHAFYDFGCFTGTWYGALATYAFLLFMYIYCFAKVRKISKRDVSDTSYVKLMLVKKYPTLERYIYEEEYSVYNAESVETVAQ